ncbi:MAG: hypothetical protein ABIH17_11260, partial [Pseudomonadota bacterium]
MTWPLKLDGLQSPYQEQSGFDRARNPKKPFNVTGSQCRRRKEMRNKLLISAALAAVLAIPALADDSQVTQQGLNQNATVDQTGSFDALSVIDQSVQGNIATVTQTDTATSATGANVNDSAILQQGIANLATVTQHNDAGQGGATNTSDIDQISSNAVAT